MTESTCPEPPQPWSRVVSWGVVALLLGFLAFAAYVTLTGQAVGENRVISVNESGEPNLKAHWVCCGGGDCVTLYPGTKCTFVEGLEVTH